MVPNPLGGESFDWRGLENHAASLQETAGVPSNVLRWELCVAGLSISERTACFRICRPIWADRRRMLCKIAVIRIYKAGAEGRRA
jgi:hypothetical protein